MQSSAVKIGHFRAGSTVVPRERAARGERVALGTARRVFVPAAVVLTVLISATLQAAEMRVYIGTYTRGDSRGIYRLSMDTGNGSLRMQGVTTNVSNPSFLAIHPNKQFLFAVNEDADFRGQKKTGAVSAFAIKQDGSLRLLNQQPSRGAAPCHLVVDNSGRFLLVANYTGGNAATFPIGQDGQLGRAAGFVQHEGSSVNPRRQQGPHAHSINLDSANQFAFVADLGLDQVVVYRFDKSTGDLKPHDPPFAKVTPGAGPRHFAFHPQGRFAYVINELHSTVTAFSYDPALGKLSNLQTLSTIPAPTPGNSTAEVQVHPTGRFVYGSNRGHNSIVVYSVNQETGRLTYVENEPTQGSTPRNFGIDPSGKFLLAANQATNNIVVFRINESTGELTPTGHQIEVPSPVCVKFLMAD